MMAAQVAAATARERLGLAGSTAPMARGLWMKFRKNLFGCERPFNT